jgi:two-component system nitrate/nitrite response regulator NarL
MAAQTSSKRMAAKPDQSIQDLVRQLIHKVEDSDHSSVSEPSTCILGIEIDGVQYTLHRAQITEPCHLSPREKEIARLVAEGLPNKCIGAVLEISPWTVATHVQRIFTKRGVSSRAAMVARLADRSATQQSAWFPAENTIFVRHTKPSKQT